jgi:hypothetical protein
MAVVKINVPEDSVETAFGQIIRLYFMKNQKYHIIMGIVLMDF